MNNWLMARVEWATVGGITSFRLRVIKRAATTVTTLSDVGMPGGAGTMTTPATLAMSVDVAGNYVATVSWGSGSFSTSATRQDAALATGGALASGKVGFYDAQTSASANTRTYDAFLASQATPDAVVYASQSAELRTEGMFRKDSAGVSFGPVSSVIGDLPRLPVSGLEGRSVELFVKLSRGDMDQLPDSGIDDLSVQVLYRPSWLFVPEA